MKVIARLRAYNIIQKTFDTVNTPFVTNRARSSRIVCRKRRGCTGALGGQGVLARAKPPKPAHIPLVRQGVCCIKGCFSAHTFCMNCVIVCVGSDKISGDSLGPLVGSLLREGGVPCPVYGAMGHAVNGVNLGEYRRFLRRYHPGVPVIAVDAAVGRSDEVGQIKYRLGGVQAGGAVGREELPLGDLAILGVVGKKGGDVLASLLSVPYHEVEALAHRIAAKIAAVLGRMEAAA